VNELIVESENELLRLTLNRPEKRNALSLPLIEALCAQFSSAKQKIILLQGSGPSFCSGLDLDQIKSPEAASLYTELARLFQLMYNSPSITLCKVHGHAYAGGIGLIAACDYAIADSRTLFCLPEMRKGIVPALVAALLKRQIAVRHLSELALLGEPIDAGRAQEIGLINAHAENPDQKLDSTIQKLLQNDPKTVMRFKKLLVDLEPMSLTADFHAALKHKSF